VGKKLALYLLGCCAASAAETTQVPRYQQGIYISLEGAGDLGSPSYAISLLDNPAVSGMTVQHLRWVDLNPNPPTSNQLPAPADCSNLPTYAGSDPYDWSYPDAAFCAVEAWNKANPKATPKGIKFVPTPGYFSPQWVLDEINTQTCKAQFTFEPQPYYIQEGDSPPASLLPPYPSSMSSCDLTYFFDWEAGTSTSNGVTYDLWQPLPMPWDSTYKSAWQTFLTAFNARYGQSPAFVGIAVAGPTSSSTEMIMPGYLGSDSVGRTNWRALLSAHYSNPAYQDSDQAYIDEWEAAIDMYGEIFSDIMLVVTTANPGFPNFVIGGGGVTGPSGTAEFCGDPTQQRLDVLCGAIHDPLLPRGIVGRGPQRQGHANERTVQLYCL
jgi:hypothetical protein